MTTLHPKKNEHGGPCVIAVPTRPTPAGSWHDPAAIATVVPGGAMPAELNGIALRPWVAAPRDDAGWDAVAGQDAGEFAEPAFVPAPGKRIAAGVVIEEPDGRVWVVHPSNAHGGYPATFPKGTKDGGVSLRATAIREAYEESGLQVELTAYLLDAVRSMSKTRYYLGRRVGGCPSDMGWESQAVSLVPRALLHALLANPNDAPLVAMLVTGSKSGQP
ncbi:NUDIX hydrolase [Massilia consociata]|uniref:NUDIX hydrolase n=1 Tax=Massilia consociata TaxID=760117 RepID=A0ABV6F9V9_9BURK